MNLFFSGLAGSGVSALAWFSVSEGHSVSGSDRAFDRNPSHPLIPVLENRGIRIVPQDGKGISRSVDLAVFSTAVENDQPEYLKAAEERVPVTTRPSFLAETANRYETVAVAGTSGKSTTSAMLACLLSELGMSPNFIGGGRVTRFRTPDNPGNCLAGDSRILVIEACESDGSIALYQPVHSIFLNVEFDHFPKEKVSALFSRLMEQTRGIIVVNGDDPLLAETASSRAVRFSVHGASAYRPDSIRYEPFATRFTLRGTDFLLDMPGRYNLSNALACIALLSELGFPLDRIAGALPVFRGVERRFSVVLNENGSLVIDDYAHNPHKIGNLMETVSKLSPSVCYIFQPHGYGPTRLMKDGYVDIFSRLLRDSDTLLLLPVFYAGGTAQTDIRSEDLADGIHKRGRDVRCIGKREDIFHLMKDHLSFVVMGARDDSLSDLAQSIASVMK